MQWAQTDKKILSDSKLGMFSLLPIEMLEYIVGYFLHQFTVVGISGFPFAVH